MLFRTKLTACVLALVALSVCLGGDLLIYASFSTALQRERDNALAAYELTRYTVASAGTAADATGMIEVMRHIQTGNGAVLRLRQAGEELFCTGRGDGFDDALSDRCTEKELAVKAIENESGRSVQITGTLPGGGGQLVLDGLYPVNEVYRSLHDQQRIYRVVFLGTVILAALVTAALMRWLTRPLAALSDASRRIAGGELDFRADASGRDEFAAVASDFNHMADKLDDRMEELRKSVRRQETFTGAFAHEMKTPMTAIIGYADMIRSQSLGEEELHTAANYIYSEGRRLEKLSGKLLELLVLQRRDFSLKPCDLAELIRDTEAELAFYREKYHITLHCAYQKGERLAERDLLKTLLLNLIDNGRKAMPQGGVIAVTQTLTEDGFVISVADHGCGMEEKELDRITEAFYRVDKSRSRALGGAGLGLAICNEIAAVHGGELTFESQPGQGTTATLTVRGQQL